MYAFWGVSAILCVICVILLDVYIFTEKENDSQTNLRDLLKTKYLKSGRGNFSIQSFCCDCPLFPIY